MDALSEVLKVVTLETAFFFNAEFSAPWSFRSPKSCELAEFIHGTDGHVSGPSAHTVDAETGLRHIFSRGLKITRMGGGGEASRFVCGYMACDSRLSQVFLAGLPPIFKVNIRDDQHGGWLENAIRYSIAEAGVEQAGGEAVLAKLSETLFIETLRRYIIQMPAQQTGWLAGVRDREVGKALALMHSRPADPWTLADLATAVGLSRSVLAQRFRYYLGEPPFVYLTRWRLQVGAQLLATTSYSVAEIACEVGYDSEPAFNRAFKREFAHPPARYRMKTKAAAKIPT